MYTNYNGNIEKNQMLTPPTIGLTTSIVNDKLNNLNLNESGSDSLVTYTISQEKDYLDFCQKMKQNLQNNPNFKKFIFLHPDILLLKQNH